MIGIRNIDKRPRSSGRHLYEVSGPDGRPLFTFYHNREEPLSILLRRAAEGAQLRELARIQEANDD